MRFRFGGGERESERDQTGVTSTAWDGFACLCRPAGSAWEKPTEPPKKKKKGQSHVKRKAAAINGRPHTALGAKHDKAVARRHSQQAAIHVLVERLGQRQCRQATEGSRHYFKLCSLTMSSPPSSSAATASAGGAATGLAPASQAQSLPSCTLQLRWLKSDLRRLRLPQYVPRLCQLQVSRVRTSVCLAWCWCTVC